MNNVKLNEHCALCTDDEGLISRGTGAGFSPGIIPGLVALSDAAVLALVGLLLFYFHPHLTAEALPRYAPVLLITSITAVLIFYFSDIYRKDIQQFYIPQINKIILLLALLFLLLITGIFALKASELYSRVWLFSWFVVSVFTLCVGRILLSKILMKSAKEGRLRRNIAIVGGEEQGARMVQLLEQHREPWMHMLAVFDDRVDRLEGNSEYPIIGNIDDLIGHVRQQQIDEILVALPWKAEKRTLEILDRLKELPVKVRLCPDLLGFNFLHSDYSSYSGVPVLHVHDKPIEGWNYVFKSIEDKVMGLVALVLTFPIMLLVSLLIKIDSKGPVFFKQKRYGFNNELIEVFKFRSMHVDVADSNAENLVTRDDPRVTRIGRLIRRSSIDELPQILNVLKGEMSMVGPRPHATKAKAAGKYYQDVVSEYAHRHKVRPGITGWAQIQGWRGETDTEEKIVKRVEHDLYYIDNWSLGFDLYILTKTILAVFRSDNAY